MRFFNALPFPTTAQYLAFVNVVQNTVAFASSSIKPQMISGSQRRAIMTRYAVSNAIIAARFLNRKNGGLFLDESIPGVPEDEPEAVDIHTFERMWNIYRRTVGGNPRTFENKEKKTPALSRKQKMLCWLITPVVKKLASATKFERFKKNPALFFSSLKSRKYRLFGKLFFPLS